MSTLKVNTIQDSGGANGVTPGQLNSGLIRAWINFQGTSTVSIRDSFNISSISDEGTGHYYINFSTSFANNDYAMTGTATEDFYGSGSRGEVVVAGDRTDHTTGQCRIFSQTTNGSATPRDCIKIEMHFIGDV